MLTYRQALRSILERADYERGPRPPYAERHYRLDRVRELAGALGDPHLDYRTVHVAGTKGKGSTSAMIASILGAAGYTTGLFTSPHLHSFRERIRIGDELIPEDELVCLVERMTPVLDERPDVTVFEIITALAMLHFAERGVDWAVFEVGLGGRLDSTNIVEPEVAVISSISLDHTNVLGDTLSRIAREKAGIIKDGIPVVSAAQRPEAMAVIEAVAKERNAPLTVVGREWRLGETCSDEAGQQFGVLSKDGDVALYADLRTPLLGEHQLENACLAVGVAETLRRAGYDVSAEAVRAGLANVRWHGRMEVLSREPLLVVDGAHNGDSMRRLLEGVARHFVYERLRVILGVGAGHQPEELVDIVARVADEVILTRSSHARAVPPSELADLMEERPCPSRAFADVATALGYALDAWQPGDLVLATGSLFLVAEAREAWFERRGLPMPPKDPPGAY